MSVQSLDTPFVATTALRSVNFFNGRLLTGDDLKREQATQEARIERLGRAVGDGIAYGFEVAETLGTSTKSQPVVTISAGLAVSRSGVALELATDLDVALVRDDPPAGAEPGALFADCQPFAPGTYTAGAGVYVLTVAPAQRGEGRAQVSGLGNTDAPCNIALSAEALKLRLIRLALPVEELAEKALLRNRVAYACFGTDALAAFVADPFGSPSDAYGLIDTLRAQTLTDDEVPLAVIGWSIDDGIQFVDLWSVRRRLTRRVAEDDWSELVADRRRAEGEARFLQLQQQLADVRDEPDADLVRATDLFEQLPAAGLVPLAVSLAGGFDAVAFFEGLKTTDPVFVEGAKLDALLEESFAFPPIALASEEAIRLYFVRENEQAAGAAQPYLVFTNGHLPYRGDAQFDLAYWNFANYARAYC